MVAGLTYNFKVESLNAFGYSVLSQPVSIFCATIPSQPTAPVTSVSTSFVTITWATPVTNGLPITSYSIYIRKGDQLTYITNNAVCDGTSALVISQTYCVLPLSTLTSTPYSLLKGYSINAYIVATNAYGSSTPSSLGNGGVIVLVTNSPILLVNDPTVTSRSVIKFTWTAPISNGGSSILDYTITYD